MTEEAGTANRQSKMSAATLPASSPLALERAAVELHADRIVAIPTETVYGLAVLPSERALERLVRAKQRSPDKGVALLVDSIEQASTVGRLNGAARRLATRFWPGPLTLVLPQLPTAPLPALLTGGRPTIGVRLPDHAVPRALARLLGPLAASSANISGEPDATTARQVMATLADDVALILDDGPVRGGVPSTVVACLGARDVTILRHGAISETEIRAAAG